MRNQNNQAVAKNADRIVVMRDGVIVKDTTDADEAIEALHTSENEEFAAAISVDPPAEKTDADPENSEQTS